MSNDSGDLEDALTTVPIDYKLKGSDSLNYKLELDGRFLKDNVEGFIIFKPIPLYRRSLQSIPDPIRDENGMPVELDTLKADFKFNYNDYQNDLKMAGLISFVDKVSSNPGSQIAIFLASLNPMMFSFTANILNKFVYFRGLRTEIPRPLNNVFLLVGNGWEIKSGKADYDNPEKKPSGLDKMMGIELED